MPSQRRWRKWRPSERGGKMVRRLSLGASEIRTPGAAAKGPAVASLVGRPALNGAAQLIDPAFIPARPGRPVSQDETASLNPSSSSGEMVWGRRRGDGTIVAVA